MESKDVQVMLVTPSMAQKWLGVNFNNRRKTSYRINQLKHDITNGKFTLNTDAIAFDTDGNLVNGQHRLEAIAQTGVACESIVAFNFPKEAVCNIDIGKSRSWSDTNRIGRYLPEDLWGKDVCSLINAYFNVKSDVYRPDVSQPQKRDFALKYEQQIKTAISICDKGIGHALLRKSGCQAAVFAAILSGEDISKLYRFGECVNTGFIEGQKETSAVVLRTYLLQVHGKNGGNFQLVCASATEQAIKDFVNDKPRRNAYHIGEHPYIK